MNDDPERTPWGESWKAIPDTVFVIYNGEGNPVGEIRFSELETANYPPDHRFVPKELPSDPKA